MTAAPFVVRARLVTWHGGTRVLTIVGDARAVRPYDHGAADPYVAAVALQYPGATVTRSTADGARIRGERERLLIVSYPEADALERPTVAVHADGQRCTRATDTADCPRSHEYLTAAEATARGIR